MFAAQMAMLKFIFPLFISSEMSHLMVEGYFCACQREREVRRKKKKAQKKPHPRDWDLNPRTLSPEPSQLSARPWRPAQRKANIVEVPTKISFMLVEKSL